MIEIQNFQQLIFQMFKTKVPQMQIVHNITIYLLEKYKFLSIECDGKNNEIYVYENGVYKNYGRKVIKEEVEKILEYYARGSLVNEIIGKIERSCYIERDELFKTPIDLLCIENGILNLKTKELSPHNSNIIFLTKLPLIYNPGEKCEKFKDFLDEVLYDRDIKICQEWFGFLLWRDYLEKKALVCIGQTDTGKTVFLNTIKNFLGEDNISTVDLHEIVSDKFATESLLNKYANVNDELTSSDLRDVSKFKKLTGRSALSAEPKFKSRFNFVSFAKLICATNKMPLTEGVIEDPESYFNRWLVFLFDNKIDEDKKNKNLEFELKAEMSGILNWALKGLDRLLKNKQFSTYMNWKEVEMIMMLNGESVFSFVSEAIEETDEFITNDDLYKGYLKYCNLNNKKAETQIWFGRKFNPPFGNRYNGNGMNGWQGIKIKKVMPVMGL